MKQITAFNYYKTLVQKSVTPIYSEVTVLREHRGVIVGRLFVSEVLVMDGIIISERVKQSNENIDIMLDENANDFHIKTRPLQALQLAKEFLNGRVNATF